jgi:hypothetical protein
MSYADYEELSATVARRCRERRNAEEEAQRELDELTKPVVRKSNGAGVLVHKTHDNARVADGAGASVERALPARTVSVNSGSELSWQHWVEERIESHLEAFGKACAEAYGEAMAGWVGGKVDPIKRELALLRHEFICLREDVALSRKLHELRSEVAEARKQVPKLPAIVDEFDARQTDLAAEQARLERELAKTKERVSKMRVDQSVDHYSISQLEKAAASKAGAIVMCAGQ